MRPTILCLVFLFHTALVFCQKTTHVFSPDSSIKIEITRGGKLSYQAFAGTKWLAGSSSIDMTLSNGHRLSAELATAKTFYHSINQTVEVPVPYRRKRLVDRYNEADLQFRNFAVQFRVYNNGFAYRIITTFSDAIDVLNEEVNFDIDRSASAWFGNVDKRENADRFHTSFEAKYRKQTISAIADTMMAFAPVTLALPNGYRLAITDANVDDYPGMFVSKSATGLRGLFAPCPVAEKLVDGEFPQYIVTERAPYLAHTNGRRSFPWRAILVAKTDVELPANDMVYLLGDSSKLSDVSWVKYGKGTDEWITGINLFDVPFMAGLNTASYKYYVDFAKRFGFDQIMLDAGWSDAKDLFKINPAVDMEELLAYAKKNNVRLMLWTLSSTLDRQLDSALQQFNKWGIASIMTDFMDRDDQKMVNFYHRVAKACAEHKISIMFHGAYPPKGLNRTWPNVLTHESILGSEWNIWSDLATPEHNVTIPYTRMLAGPLDYEPGLLLNAQPDQFKSIGKNPMSQGTRCQQLAMFVVYDSPLQIFSGNISQGFKEPAFMDLLGSIPTTWDETRILEGRIGEYIVTARRKGDDWYIAGINNNESREIKVCSSSIDSSAYTVTVCKDGLNANNYAADYELSSRDAQPLADIKIKMASGGGFLIRLKRKHE